MKQLLVGSYNPYSALRQQIKQDIADFKATVPCSDRECVGAQQPQIAEYRDYRDYLRDFYKYRKKLNPRLSMQSWARNLKLASHSSLSMIFHKKRHLSLPALEIFIHRNKLPHKEAQELRNKVLAAKLNSEAVYDLDTVVNSQRSTTSMRSLWPLFFLREWKSILNKSKNKRWQLPQSKNQKTLRLLTKELEKHKKAGLIYFDAEDKVWRLDSEKFKHFLDQHFSREQFHNEIVKLLTQYPLSKNKKEFHSSFIKVKKQNIEKAQKLVDEYSQQLTKLCDDPAGDEVLLLNLQIIKVL